jgi:hypothetical protein
MFNEILPSWVEVDPLKSRAIDPLGLQLISGRLADRLLPGLSVLTTRARYFSFLCWARAKTGTVVDERKIHQCEVELALVEARLSANDSAHKDECRFVGRDGIAPFLKANADAGVLPRDPRTVYKVPVWRAYRASMVDLGLLQGSPSHLLTDTGHQAASAFRRAIGVRSKRLPEMACLSRIRESPKEKRVLRDAIGLSLRGKLDADWDSADHRGRRAAMGRLMREFSSDGRVNPKDLLQHFEAKRSAFLPEPQNTLRAAAIWEYITLGLNLVFVSWVRAADSGEFMTFRRALRRNLSNRRIRPSLSDVLVQDNDFDGMTLKAVAYLARAVRLFDGAPVQSTILLESGKGKFDLARAILNRRTAADIRAEQLLQTLFELHTKAKGDEVWLRAHDSNRMEKFRVNRESKKSWQPPIKVPMHGYRLLQFGQIAYDLGGY